MPRKQKEKIFFIYKTTNIVNGKYYIGMHTTTDVNDDYLGSGKRLYYSINKYGRENHVREILEYCNSKEELVQREKEIVTLDEIAKTECMNLKVGGIGGFKEFTKEERKKITDKSTNTLKERLKDEKYKLDYSNKIKKGLVGKYVHPGMIGKKHSEYTKNKMRKNKENNSQYGTCWITNEIESKKINKNDLIPDGWKLGRKMK